MELENLEIEGEPKGARQFSFELGPGKSTHKMLKPSVDGEATSIQMRFEFKLDDI